jgi:hypothetical protein
MYMLNGAFYLWPDNLVFTKMVFGKPTHSELYYF